MPQNSPTLKPKDINVEDVAASQDKKPSDKDLFGEFFDQSPSVSAANSAQPTPNHNNLVVQQQEVSPGVTTLAHTGNKSVIGHEHLVLPSTTAPSQAAKILADRRRDSLEEGRQPS